MVNIEEIPKGRNSNVYFSSLYHLNPVSNGGRNNIGSVTNSTSTLENNADQSNDRQQGSSKRKRVNYNVQQIQAEQFLTARPKSKSLGKEFEVDVVDLTNESQSTISIAELRRATRRFEELNRENYNENIKIEIPKNVTGLVVKRENNASSVVKRLIISKKTWSNYVDELNKSELRLITNGVSPLEVKPNALQLEKLCTICGGVSYSSCIKCSIRVCSVKCQNIHNETRCTHF